MPSLQSYAVRGNHYWRIVESYRDKHGHPRLRVLRHLGTADKLLQLLSQAPGRPLCADERDSVALRPSGTWLGSSTCCAPSTPRPPNESKDLRWASTCFSPP